MNRANFFAVANDSGFPSFLFMFVSITSPCPTAIICSKSTTISDFYLHFENGLNTTADHRQIQKVLSVMSTRSHRIQRGWVVLFYKCSLLIDSSVRLDPGCSKFATTTLSMRLLLYDSFTLRAKKARNSVCRASRG